MLIDTKTLEEWRDLQLQKWVDQLPNANINIDSMIYMDAFAVAEVMYLLQQDSVTLTNNAFLAYATGDELSNLGLDRGITRSPGTKAMGVARFMRDTLGTTDYVIPLGTLISTQPSVLDGTVIAYETTAVGTIFGQLVTPTGLSSTLSATGGAIGAGTYNYKVAAVDGNGNETDPSTSTTEVVASGTTNSISLSRTTVPNAVLYNIYIDTGSGYFLLDNSLIPSYTDIIGSTASILVPEVSNMSGSTYADIDIQCTQVGQIGNTAPLTVTAFINKPLGVDEVTNLASIFGGTDEEDDDTYRERIRDTLSNNTSKVTITGYRITAESYPGVATASVSTGVGAFRNEIQIIITADNLTGVPSAQLILDVQAFMMLDENRAPCDDITVVGPVVHPINYTVDVITYDTLLTQAVVEQSIKDNMEAYLPTIPIGTDVLRVNMQNIIHDTAGVIDFDLTIPAANVALAPNEVAIAGVATITF